MEDGAGRASGVVTRDMCLILVHMAVHSSEIEESDGDGEPKWVRAVGLDSAWSLVPARDHKEAANL